MADNSGLLSYGRPNPATTTQTELEAEYRPSYPAANTTRIKVFNTLDPANEAQVSTITITAGVTTDNYVVEVSIGGTSTFYRHEQTATDTADTIAEFLATIINTRPQIKAEVAANVITITSLVPGEVVTLDNAQSTTVGNLVVATTTAASGTVLHRKVAEVDVLISISATGFLQTEVSGRWYNGDDPATVASNLGPLKATHSKSQTAIQANAGITI